MYLLPNLQRVLLQTTCRLRVVAANFIRQAIRVETDRGMVRSLYSLTVHFDITNSTWKREPRNDLSFVYFSFDFLLYTVRPTDVHNNVPLFRNNAIYAPRGGIKQYKRIKGVYAVTRDYIRMVPATTARVHNAVAR